MSTFLPLGILEDLEVTYFSEVQKQDAEVLYTTELHVYYDEHDNHTPDISGSVSDDFSEKSCLFGFPIRGKKASMCAGVSGRYQTSQPSPHIRF